MDIYLLHQISQDCLKAAAEGRTEDLRAAIAAGADIEFDRLDRQDGSGSMGQRPLQAALSGSPPHWDCVEVLLDAGANVNVRNRYNWSILHQACKEGWTDFVAKLLDKAAMPWLVDNECATPLHAAAEAGHTDIMRLLLSSEQKDVILIDATDVNDETPLMKAAKHGHLDAVQYLAGIGSDFTLRNRDGASARDLADPHPDTADWLADQVFVPVKPQEPEFEGKLAPLVNDAGDVINNAPEAPQPRLSSIGKRR
jgi:ankyrin repeat protein